MSVLPPRPFVALARDLVMGSSGLKVELSGAIRDSNLSTDMRFAAFYCLLQQLRRQYDLDEYRRLVEQQGQEFSTRPLYDVVLVDYYMSLVDRSDSHLEEALYHANNARHQLPDVAGVHRQYADVIATRAERSITVTEGELKDAESAIRRAMELSAHRYGKHSATLARLLVARGCFNEARQQLNRAIEQENSAARDYVLRLSDYQTIRLRIDIAEERARLGRERDSALEEVRGARSETLTLLGLLAAVIAFIVSTNQAVQRTAFADASGLLVLQAGVILSVFAAYTVLFTQTKYLRIAVVLILGLALVAAGAKLPGVI